MQTVTALPLEQLTRHTAITTPTDQISTTLSVDTDTNIKQHDETLLPDLCSGYSDLPLPELSLSKRIYLGAEFTVLFVILPVVMFVLIRFRILPGALMPALWVWATICAIYLYRNKSFSNRRFIGIKNALSDLPRVLIFFAIGMVLLSTIRILTNIDLLFQLPRERPFLWGMIMLLYPVFSVLSQGIIYRNFLFQRYRPIFKSDLGILILGAAVFGFGHIVMGNWQAPALTFVGGLIFGWTYLRSKSGLLASIEHALYGCFMFTIGLNSLIFAGSQLMANRASGG